MNEVDKAYGAAAGSPAPVTRGYDPRVLGDTGVGSIDVNHSENGFNFVGEDSLGNVVKGFVQTTDSGLAESELERAGIHVASKLP